MQASPRKERSCSIKDFDLFGQSVQFTYQGRSAVSSWVGIVLSFALTGLFCIYLVIKTSKFIGDGGGSSFAMMNMPSDPEEGIDLA